MSIICIVVATMRVERYYLSVREEVSPLSEDVLTLLDVMTANVTLLDRPMIFLRATTQISLLIQL